MPKREDDPSVSTWESEYFAEAESVSGMLKYAKINGSNWGGMPAITLFSDEPVETVGGGGHAPTPLAYFVAGTVLCEMTMLEIYARMLGVALEGVRVEATATFRAEATGSVRKGGRKASMLGLRTRCYIDSNDPEEQVLSVVRLAKENCFARQALLNPVPIDDAVELNGRDVAW